MYRNFYFIVVVFSLIIVSDKVAQAQDTIQHPTCHLYLPVNSKITSWGDTMKIFIKKGYIPIEANFTKPQVVKHDMFQDSFFDKTVDVTDEDKLPDAGELAAGFEFHVDLVGTEDELGFKKSVCTAKFSIKKVIRKNPFQTGVLFYKTKINTTRKLGWEFPAYNCKLSKILDAIPTCKIGR